jgi:para-nitrobenzyl esterase
MNVNMQRLLDGWIKMHRILVRVLLGWLISSSLAVVGCAPRDDQRGAPRLRINGEKVTGQYLASGDNHVVFRGMPYAAPPVGDLRWRPPAPYRTATGSRDALEFAPPCPQPDGAQGNVSWYWDVAEGFGQEPGVVPPMGDTSEDCLYLNIWSTNWRGRAKHPVMVWIHGGSNHTGWSHESLYRGASLARRGVVVVTINYRVGEFGFLAHPALSAESAQHSSGNYGLLDQIAALRWVQEHIDQFGGDPDRVTIFGESAGGANVGYLMASPEAKGLFHRAISQSGGYQMNDSRTLEFEEARGRKLARALRVEEGGDVAAALRRLTAQEILQASALFADEVDYGPNVDGWVLPDTPAAIFESGQQNDVPLIVGANANEWSMYVDPEMDLGTYNKTLQESFGELALIAVELYPVTKTKNISISYDRWKTNEFFLCPSKRMAAAMENVNSPVFFYLFSRVTPGGESIGAYHGAELAYVFGTQEDWMLWAQDDWRLSNTIARYWVQFAATGDPNGDDLMEWPAFESATGRFMEFGRRHRIRTGLQAEACLVHDEVERRLAGG